MCTEYTLFICLLSQNIWRPGVSQPALLVHPSLLESSRALRGCATISLFTSLLMDIWVICIFGLLQIFVRKSPHGQCILLSWVNTQEWSGQLISQVYIEVFKKLPNDVSEVIVIFSFPVLDDQRLPSFIYLPSLGIASLLNLSHFSELWWYLTGVLICIFLMTKNVELSLKC